MNLMVAVNGLEASTAEELALLSKFNDFLREFEQIPIVTEHLIHGGMYCRTIRLRVGEVTLGSLVKIATVLIFNGPITVHTGERQLDFDGFNVIPGSAGRQQAFVARGDVQMTMMFPTAAKTVEQAESEVFADVHMLMSRNNDNVLTLTGE